MRVRTLVRRVTVASAGVLVASVIAGTLPSVANATGPAGLTASASHAATVGGYWMIGGDGGIFSFGAAGFHGSTASLTLNKPIVGMGATPPGTRQRPFFPHDRR